MPARAEHGRRADETIRIRDMMLLPSGLSDGDETEESESALSVYFIRLLMPDQQTIQALPVKDTIVIGRLVDHDNTVGLDLNGFKGHEMGVSRYHAAIVPLGGQLLLHDLESTNGTRLNGHKCRPKTAYPLQSGDIVRVGRLDLKVLSVPNNNSKA